VRCWKAARCGSATGCRTADAREGAPQRAALLFVLAGRWTINTDQLVAVRISNVGEIDLSSRPLAHAGRVLDRGAAIGDPGFVRGRGQLRAAWLAGLLPKRGL